MLVDGFTKSLPQPVFEDKYVRIRVINIETDNWVEILRICNEDDGYSIFYLFFIYNKLWYWAARLKKIVINHGLYWYILFVLSKK